MLYKFDWFHNINVYNIIDRISSKTSTSGYISPTFILSRECQTRLCHRPSRRCPRRHSKSCRRRPNIRDNGRRDIRVSCIYGTVDLSSAPFRRRRGTCDVPRQRSPTNHRASASAASRRSMDPCRTPADESWPEFWLWLAWTLVSETGSSSTCIHGDL